MSSSTSPISPPLQRSVSVLACLRCETKLEHERLERDLDLLQPGLTRAEYEALLVKLYGFYASWESLLRPSIARWLPEYGAEREKLPWLRSDLRHFGRALHNIQLCTALPKCTGLPDLLGQVYVTEGATLGGQVIARHLEASLGLDGGRGYAFFVSYGPEVSKKWREFQNLLIQKAAPDEEDRIVASARQVYIALHGWLGRPDRYGRDI